MTRLKKTSEMTHRKIPCYAKWIFTIFMVIFIPSYWIGHGPANFLWFSDVVLFLAFFATLFESRFLASMAAAGGFLFLSLWNVDFVFTLFAYLFDINLAGFTVYIFNSESSIWLRILSLFHVALLPYLLWLIYRLGYHKRAWVSQTALFGIVMLITWFVTDPSRNINAVFSYKIYNWINMGAISFLTIEFVIVAIVVALSHFFLKTFKKT